MLSSCFRINETNITRYFLYKTWMSILVIVWSNANIMISFLHRLRYRFSERRSTKFPYKILNDGNAYLVLQGTHDYWIFPKLLYILTFLICLRIVCSERLQEFIREFESYTWIVYNNFVSYTHNKKVTTLKRMPAFTKPLSNTAKFVLRNNLQVSLAFCNYNQRSGVTKQKI